MFNWFRRKKENKENIEQKPSVVEDKQSNAPSETSEIQSQPSLEWAKAAYANIQKQKQEIPENSEDERVASVENNLSAEEENVDSSSMVEEKTEEVKENAPAWMQKSDRLSALKETAIETEKEEETALDEDFVWSAQVLESQGRTPDDVSEEEFTWLRKLRQGLGKTRRNFVNQLKSVIGQGPLNQNAIEQIEAMLYSADVGYEATEYIVNTLQNKLKEESLASEDAIASLKEILQQVLDEPLQRLTKTEFEPEAGKLNIWLLTGVNGVGKTTTIGKLAHLAKTSGYNCVIAAADTFRAAAVEQVKVWGERTNTPVIANEGKNTDPAAVVFDGINAAIARNADILLVDTAGRLQNKKNLMEELAKIRRIIDKKAVDAHIESLLVLDATLGQNGLKQAQVFSEAAQLTGVVLTKLDGTAKGGVALGVSRDLGLPIRFIGAGEGIEDLRPFSSYEFVEALLS